MKRYKTYLVLAVFLILPVTASAGTYSMVSLFTDIPEIIKKCDCLDMPAPLYLATFSDGSSDNSTDNSTGSASAGTLTMDVGGRSFDNETGTYISYGIFFNGSWTASEYDSSATAYWEKNIYINYSFFFMGLFIDPMVMGAFFTNTRATGEDPVSSIVPFFGILVADT